MKNIHKKIENNLRIYKKDIKTKGLYWSVVHRIYKIPIMRKVLTPIVNALKPNFVMVGNYKLYIDKWDTTISQELVQSGKWEDYETELFKKNIKPGNTVVDIGAHIGYYTIIAASLVGKKGKVYAFEPDPINFQLLKKNVEENGFNNVVLVKKAVSNKEGDKKLYLNKENTGDHRIFNTSDDRTSVSIVTTALDEFFKLKVKRVDVIKMDIQGAEVLAFKGASKLISKNKNLILITEFWPLAIQQSGRSAKEYLILLEKNTFKIYDIDESGRKVKNVTTSQLLASYSTSGDKSTNLLCVR